MHRGHYFLSSQKNIVFSYVVDGKRHYVTIGPGNEHGEAFVVMAGDGDGFLVRCDVSVSTTSSHPHGGKQRTTEIVDILVKPYWSHRGAVRFLELVRSGYYDGVVFHRSMPDFVTQFGIARDYDVRTRERKNAMQDDDDAASRRGDIKFERGYLSFAGYGPNSRSTEVFVVNAGVSESELGKFGDNRWERPFGHIIVAVGDDADDDDGALSRIYSGYGDMFPFGDGEALLLSLPLCVMFVFGSDSVGSSGLVRLSLSLLIFIPKPLKFIKVRIPTEYTTSMDTPRIFLENSPSLITSNAVT